MKNLPVNWHEGMFLRPQHFQAAERYWSELLETSERWDHAYNYGLYAVEFSRESIANAQFELSRCLARLPDGTLVTLVPGQEPDRVMLKPEVANLQTALADLSEAFNKETVVRVYLGVPKVKLGRPNVGPPGAADRPRYSGTRSELPDETAGGNDQEIGLRTLNVRLLLSTQELVGYDLLPIAQIKRAGSTEASPQLDESYIPPVLNVEAWAPLSRDYVRAIYDMVGERIELYSEWMTNRGVLLSTHEAGDYDRVAMLRVLNEYYASLRCLAFAKGVHPFQMYTELCRFVGALSIFKRERRSGEIPAYDHDDLARIFRWIKQEISDLLHLIQEDAFEQRYFEGFGIGMLVKLEPKWLSAGWAWYIGVQRGSLSEEDCRKLLLPGALDWKISSSRKVEELFIKKIPGVTLTPLAQVPRVLPTLGGWVFYQVSRNYSPNNPAKPAWDDVVETNTLAMRFAEKFVANLRDLQGQRKLVINAGGKMSELQFCLFAVRQKIGT